MWMMSMVEMLFFSSDVFPYGVLCRICRSWNVAWNVDPNTGSWTIHQGRILQASIRSCWLAGCHSGTQRQTGPKYCDILWSFVIQRNHDRVRHTVDMFHSFPVRIIVWFKKGIRQRAKCLFLCQECLQGKCRFSPTWNVLRYLTVLVEEVDIDANPPARRRASKLPLSFRVSIPIQTGFSVNTMVGNMEFTLNSLLWRNRLV